MSAVRTQVVRNAGHPWDKRPGFDGLHVWATTAEVLDAFIAAAEKKFWGCWIRGTVEGTGEHAAYLYKPCGATAPWEDTPERPAVATEVAGAKVKEEWEFRCHDCTTDIRLGDQWDDPTTSSGACPTCGGANWDMYLNGKRVP